jgi:hypothetical protein
MGGGGYYERHYIFRPFTIGNCTRQIVAAPCMLCLDHFLCLYAFLGPLFVKLHMHQPCFEALRTNTPFLSCISTLWLKPLGRCSRQNGVSALGAFKTGQLHFVHEAVQILLLPAHCLKAFTKQNVTCKQIIPHEVGLHVGGCVKYQCVVSISPHN